MTVHTFNYSNSSGGIIDRIIDIISVCTEISSYYYVQLFYYCQPEMMSMSLRIVVSIVFTLYNYYSLLSPEIMNVINNISVY